MVVLLVPYMTININIIILSSNPNRRGNLGENVVSFNAYRIYQKYTQ
jgi:hypothetical protein